MLNHSGLVKRLTTVMKHKFISRGDTVVSWRDVGELIMELRIEKSPDLREIRRKEKERRTEKTAY